MVDIKKLQETPISEASATERRPEGAVEYTSDHEDMIDDLQAHGFGNSQFLESIYEWGNEKGWLTEAQDRKLREMWDGI